MGLAVVLCSVDKVLGIRVTVHEAHTHRDHRSTSRSLDTLVANGDGVKTSRGLVAFPAFIAIVWVSHHPSLPV